MEQLQSGRGVPFVVFKLRPLGTKSGQFWFGVCADKREKKRFLYGKLKRCIC